MKYTQRFWKSFGFRAFDAFFAEFSIIVLFAKHPCLCT
jgi:hypothetical protein